LSEYEAPLTPIAFDISDHAALLHDGVNVLAIRLLNDSPTGDDALLQFTLVGESREGPPLAVDDAAETLEGQPITVNILSNDGEGSDPIDARTVTIGISPANGTAEVNDDGTVTYTPNAAYEGSDSFTYLVHDESDAGTPVSRMLVAPSASVRALVPSNGLLANTWRGGDEPFDDDEWLSGYMGVGYDATPATFDFTPYIGLNVLGMRNLNGSVYMRSSFSLNEPESVTSLILRMRYDDGFVAFLNGVEIARSGAPPNLGPVISFVSDEQRWLSGKVFRHSALKEDCEVVEGLFPVVDRHGPAA
jgi:hypothetical protein